MAIRSRLTTAYGAKASSEVVVEPLPESPDLPRLPYGSIDLAGSTPPRACQEAPQIRRAAMFTGVSAFQMRLIYIIAGMMGAGVFERYPCLRVSFGESGAGWLGYALHRMDFEFGDRFRDLRMAGNPP